MPRYVKDVPTGLSRAEAKEIISRFLASQGFVFGDERGEPVWRRGGGGLVAPQFIKAVPDDRTVHIEAWLPRFVIFPGVHKGEEGLDGWYGFAVKALLRARVTELEARLGGGRVPGSRLEPATKRAPSLPRPSHQVAGPRPAGWYPDPIGKHAFRYWEGTKWTVHVSDGE